MRVLGIDVGLFILIVELAVALAAFLISGWQERRGSNKKAEIASFIVGIFSLILLMVSSLLFLYFYDSFDNKVETKTEKGWELSKYHDLASLASFNAGYGDAWAMFGFGSGSVCGELSSHTDAGAYLFVERLDDGGLRELTLAAEHAVIYETSEPDYRAELWSPIYTHTDTLIDASWWFPSTADKYADGAVVRVVRPTTQAKEWRVYVPAGSIIAGSWGTGIGLDSSKQK